MPKRLFNCLFILLICLSLKAQQTEKQSPTDIYHALQKLNFLGSVLYVAAHPDDENTRLISYMSNHEKARTGYLSLTRGDGGQNLIGPEIRELLGVIRTQELLAARRIDGGEQLFTRANDFGYSKDPEETLSIWNKDDVLSDVILAIRKFKPDIIINRFDHRSPGTTHGHHTSSAMLSVEAFDIAGDASVFPDMAKEIGIWQPKRIFFNTSWWFYGSQENFEKADKGNLLSFDIGTFYPSKGLSNNEIAALASSQHLSQGFGRLSDRGSQKEYIEFLKGAPLNGNNIFAGIDTSWNRVKGGKAIGDILYNIEKDFNFREPSVHIPDLMKAYLLIQKLEDYHWKTLKTREIKSIIKACAGLYLEASAENSSSTLNKKMKVSIEAINRSNFQNIKLIGLSLQDNSSIQKNLDLQPNSKEDFKIEYHISSEDKYTSPYWLEKKWSLGMYTVDDPALIGLPETPKNTAVNFNLEINGTPITFKEDVVYRYSKPDKGELYKPFEIIPEASAKLSEKVIIFENNNQKEIEVLVKAGKDDLEGFIEICHPDDWNVYPDKQKIAITNKGEEQKLVFTIIPPKNQSEGFIGPIISVGDKKYTKELVEINYGHIPFQTVLLPSESKVVRLDIKKKGNNIAYIAGAGDVVPESLRQIGYHVLTLKPEDINAETLNRFDAVVIGIRAYNTIDELKFKQQILFDFVEKGGNMIVQYNTNSRLKVDKLAPYDLTLSRDRVTDENAEVTILDPNHPLLNYPNKITSKDFEGWTQERGLYFPNAWSQEFTPLLSMNDPGESPKNGSLLVAKYGKGYYIYTGLSFFREFPEGVSGAYRLFSNMLSIGKEDLKQDEALKN